MNNKSFSGLHCLRQPIEEIFDAARMLNAGVNAHLEGRRDDAERLFAAADMPQIRAWTESLWGAKSPYVHFRLIQDAPPVLFKPDRYGTRMPDKSDLKRLLERDKYHCRFCGIPVIRKEVRQKIRSVYPTAVSWERYNLGQHAAFQAMWAQYDHVLPHSRGGTSELDNMVVTCAPCNFARMEFTLAEVGLTDPRLREPIGSDWDGLERFAVPISVTPPSC
jgi:hypothetical protein